MSVLSITCCSLLSAVCAFTLVSAAGCGTEAQGVDDCREIEQTRCAAAKNCGIVSDVEACQRYYRDQCLHGLPVPPPGSGHLKACVDVIRAAGVCAQSGGVDTELGDCDDLALSNNASELKTACDLVREPEKTQECSFLTPGADAGTGGASNSGDGTAGQAGENGTSGAEGS
ncbi:MAG TPA: hypothetical protein VER04_18555 [Polyangiaceae bacterium]|nr:hypothetical protein [Polyangiaceae bacterium]